MSALDRRMSAVVALSSLVACAKLAGPNASASATAPSVIPPMDASAQLTAASANEDRAPRALACLAHWYGATPQRRRGDWGLMLAAEPWLPLHDGIAKDFQKQLERPDLYDMLSQRYESNRSASPIARAGFDPGRIRVESLFRSVYGASAEEVERRLVAVNIMGREVRFHGKAAGALERVANRLKLLHRSSRIIEEFDRVDTFSWRVIEGTERLSAHAFGIAIDLNPGLADFWRWSKATRWRHPMPLQIVAVFESEGFVWGGSWNHYDSMHFEYRPEMFDPDCQASE